MKLYRVEGILKSIIKALIEYLRKLINALVRKWLLWFVCLVFVAVVAVLLLLWFLLGRPSG